MIGRLLNKILGDNLDYKLKEKFMKGSFSSVLLQISLSVLTFLTTIIVARITGDKGFGIYTLVFTWAGIISTAAVFGFDDLTLRLIPAFISNGKKKEAESYIKWAFFTLIKIVFIITFLYIIIACFLPLNGLKEYADFHVIAALSIPFYVFIIFLQSVLRAYGFISEGQLSEKLFQPLIFVFIFILFYFFENFLTDFHAILFRVVSFLIAFILIVLVFYFKIYKHFNRFIEPVKNTKPWLRSCFYFSVSTLLYSVNTRIDIIFLGIYNLEPEKIAYYNVALKFSDIALIPFLVITTVTTPMFSSLFYQDKLKDLQLFYTKITRVSLLTVSILVIIFLSFGPWFLSWYGKSFTEGYQVLFLLCISKLIHVFIGPANYLLSMIGKEKTVSLALLLSVIITILLHIILIPIFEINGAAYATLAGLVFFDLFLAFKAYQTSGFRLSAIG